jgi:nucleoside 2-deoxyribosyltransferase
MRHIYLASSWRNDLQPFVVRELREAGHRVYDFRHPAPDDDGFHWSEIDPQWQAWSPYAFRDALAHPIADRGFGNDWGAMESADTGVLLLPGVRGAHLEAGYFVGAGKPLYILIGYGANEPELMYRMATAICLTTGHLLDELAAAGVAR